MRPNIRLHVANFVIKNLSCSWIHQPLQRPACIPSASYNHMQACECWVNILTCQLFVKPSNWYAKDTSWKFPSETWCSFLRVAHLNLSDNFHRWFKVAKVRRAVKLPAGCAGCASYSRQNDWGRWGESYTTGRPCTSLRHYLTPRNIRELTRTVRTSQATNDVLPSIALLYIAVQLVASVVRSSAVFCELMIIEGRWVVRTTVNGDNYCVNAPCCYEMCISQVSTL